MPILIAAIVAFIRSLLYSAKDPKFRGLLIVVVVLVLSGMIFYHNIEGWNYLDALYFCIVTLATVGYGDFTPKTTAGKIFTMIFIVFGIGIFLAFVNSIVMDIAKRRSEREASKKER